MGRCVFSLTVGCIGYGSRHYQGLKVDVFMISAETKLICRQPQIVFVGCCVSACSGMELSQETGYQLFKKAEFSDSAVR
jgi:hypothetical protein